MQVLNVSWKWNVPNSLSLLRLALVPAFAVLYLMQRDLWAFALLAVSGLTDCLDGFIARRFNQITDCGKLLDPLADKLTQVTVVICLTTRYPQVLPLTIICFIKELCQGIGGIILLRGRCEVRGAKWFGKVSTVVFYLCMLAIVLWNSVMPAWVFWLLVSVACVTTLCAFFGYLRIFLQISRKEKADPSAPAAQTEKG